MHVIPDFAAKARTLAADAIILELALPKLEAALREAWQAGVEYGEGLARERHEEEDVDR